MIPYGRQYVSSADVDAVLEVLRSDWLTQGPAVPRFEEAVSGYTGARHAIAVNSATSALHIACLALGLGPGDRLWTVPNTFVATANCARYCGAQVEFIDIDRDTWNISIPALEDHLLRARRSAVLPKIVVPVHFAGQPTEQEAIANLAKEFGFRIIEDASHAIGASRNGEPVGSCQFSDISVFSFHPVKIITTGEGGMALTNDPELARSMALLRTHGITKDRLIFSDQNSGPWAYEQKALGFNYRLTDIQAALGLSQLARLRTLVERREVLAKRYDTRLATFPCKRPTIIAGNRSAWHLYVIRVAAVRRRLVFEAMRSSGVGVNVHYTPVHLQPYYKAMGFKIGDCPEAEAHGAEALSLPLYPELSETDQDLVIRSLHKALVEPV
jgi:UDP-4-amino-4,6-dideoxy-N-acetyl-beta-L-altrosamine transaminase